MLRWTGLDTQDITTGILSFISTLQLWPRSKMTRQMWDLRFLLKHSKQRKSLKKSKSEDPEAKELIHKTKSETENSIITKYSASSVISDCGQCSRQRLLSYCFVPYRYLHRRRKTIIYLITATLVSTAVIFGLKWLYWYPTVKKETPLKHCTIPDLNPVSPEVRPFLQQNERPKCLYEQTSHFNEIPFLIQNGIVLVKNSKIDPANFDSCCYRPFKRDGDNNVQSSNFCKKLNEVYDETLIHEEHEFIEVLCINSDTDFRDGFALIQTKDKVESRVREFDSYRHSRLNVLILGLDTTSQMNFLRAMPKSNNFLTQNLSAILLKGYTKVGENTLPNAIPLLTGKSLEEFKLDCVDKHLEPENVHLDKCQLIWKLFAENGFRTAFSEDDASTGLFNLYWPNAFVAPPTDYYLRPYSILMHDQNVNRNGYCHGATLSFEKLLENMKTIADVFAEETPSYFHFTWSSKLSHDNFNNLQWGDEPLLKFLEHFHSNGYFKNTVLFIIGDHGSRLNGIRSTVQGQIEDRMPIAYIALPEWFKERHKRAYENLKRNANQITSAFDLHKTLLAFINTDNLKHEKDNIWLPNGDKISLKKFPGTSLFRTFSVNRSCSSAGIPLHWCVCHEKIPKDSFSEEIRTAGEFVVSSVNKILKGYDSCATLNLQTVDQALKLDSEGVYLEICNTDLINEKSTESPKNNLKDAKNGGSTSLCSGEAVQISVTVEPSGATFETTVIQKRTGEWHIFGEIVRTNSYQGDSECVEKQELKPFCYCVEGIDETY